MTMAPGVMEIAELVAWLQHAPPRFTMTINRQGARWRVTCENPEPNGGIATGRGASLVEAWAGQTAFWDKRGW